MISYVITDGVVVRPADLRVPSRGHSRYIVGLRLHRHEYTEINMTATEIRLKLFKPQYIDFDLRR